MPETILSNAADRESLEALFDEFERRNPGFRMGLSSLQGESTELCPEHEGVRYLWILNGEAKIFLPRGYRTQEERLHEAYVTDELSEDISLALGVLREGLDRISEEVPYGGSIRDHVRRILERYQDGAFRGDISGEIAQITPISRGGWCHAQWSESEPIRRAIDLLIDKFTEIGWSTKREDSYEFIGMGDQVAIRPHESVIVRGGIRYLWIEDLEKVDPHTSTTRRVHHLKDLAGGCNIAFDPFRRLLLTWCVKGIDTHNPDGINRVNSHIVNMAEELSRTHFHPVAAVGGGKPQHELYMVLDPTGYGLSTYGRRSYAYFFPNIENLSEYERVDLHPGDIVYIPPGTAHRGVNVLANVLMLPGFKPGNEWYIDRKIKNVTDGNAPYNEQALSISSRYDIG
jgi:hypothetical protein